MAILDDIEISKRCASCSGHVQNDAISEIRPIGMSSVKWTYETIQIFPYQWGIIKSFLKLIIFK